MASTTYSKNKKAFHDYEILETFEAGIVLNGDEVKSIKASQLNLKGSFADFEKEELFLNQMHVSRYNQSSRNIHDPTRRRKLILHKKEIFKIAAAISQKGVTAIPLEIYGKGGLIKAKIGLCRGKKLHDKRDTMRKKAQDMEIKKQLKRFGR